MCRDMSDTAPDRTFNISDPKVWNSLPPDTQKSINTEMQSVLVSSCLRNTAQGRSVVERKQAGHDVSKQILLLERRDERTVDARTRKVMESEGRKWQVRLYPLSGQPPKNASKAYISAFRSAKKHKLPEGFDLYCIIASEKQVHLVEVSIAKHLEEIALVSAPDPIRDVQAKIQELGRAFEDATEAKDPKLLELTQALRDMKPEDREARETLRAQIRERVAELPRIRESLQAQIKEQTAELQRLRGVPVPPPAVPLLDEPATDPAT